MQEADADLAHSRQLDAFQKEIEDLARQKMSLLDDIDAVSDSLIPKLGLS
jgi:hypothetical protein